MNKVCLGSIYDIAEGQAKGYDPTHSGKDTLFVVRKGEQVHAYIDICPHYSSTSLPWKRHQYLDASAQHIVCAAHGALFNIENGLCLRGPCKGQSLKKLNVEVLPDDKMWVDLITIEEFKL